MSTELLYLLIGFGALIIGIGIGIYIQRLKTKTNESVWNEKNNQLDSLLGKSESERTLLFERKQSLEIELAKEEEKFKHLEEKFLNQKGEIEKLQEKFTESFKNLANEILDEKSKKFTESNEENIKKILNPLQDKIKEFQGKVQENQEKNIGLHAALKQQLSGLKDLNTQMTKEATNLTKALKGDSKTQGNWGELILENVLEKSNLTKDREYFVQKTIVDHEGHRQVPDVIVNLPGRKKMIIDSKVSLTAYERFSSSENDDDKKRFLKKHIDSLKSHISLLKQKKYEDIYKTESPDFVLMFIPIEPALYLAQNEDNNFFFTAFNSNILLVSPTTLLSVLRTIDTIWKNEKQQQNAIDIANHATSLYTKFNNLLLNLETVGNRINSTQTAYQDAMKKLTGNQNLIKDIDKLEKLGLAPKTKISQKWLDKANVDSEDEQSKLEL